MNAVLTPLPARVFAHVDPRPAVAREFDTMALASGEALVLGGYWYALHFTLCGEVPFPSTAAAELDVEWLDDPLEDALMGGTPAGIPDDLGGARFHTPAAASSIADALSEITDADIRERFDGDLLTENAIPPAHWDDPRAADAIAGEFRRLQAFYGRCRETGSGVLLRVVAG